MRPPKNFDSKESKCQWDPTLKIKENKYSGGPQIEIKGEKFPTLCMCKGPVPTFMAALLICIQLHLCIESLVE